MPTLIVPVVKFICPAPGKWAVALVSVGDNHVETYTMIGGGDTKEEARDRAMLFASRLGVAVSRIR